MTTIVIILLVVVLYFSVIYISRKSIISSRKKSLLSRLLDVCKNESELYRHSEEKKYLSLYNNKTTLSEAIFLKETLAELDLKEKYISDLSKFVEKANSLDENNIYIELDALMKTIEQVILNIHICDSELGQNNTLIWYDLVVKKASIRNSLIIKNEDLPSLRKVYKDSSYLLIKLKNDNAFK